MGLKRQILDFSILIHIIIELGLGPDQIWNSAVKGLDQMLVTAYKQMVSDKTCGALIRKHLSKNENAIWGVIDNETL
jgi:hypothetical protein